MSTFFLILGVFCNLSNTGNAIWFCPHAGPLKSWLLDYFFSRAKEVSRKVGIWNKSFRGKRGKNNSTGRKDSLWQGPGQGNDHIAAFLRAKACEKLNLHGGCLLCPGIELGSLQRPVSEPETLNVLFSITAGFTQGVQLGEGYGWGQLSSEGLRPAREHPHPGGGLEGGCSIPWAKTGVRRGGEERFLLIHLLPISCQILLSTLIFWCNRKLLNFKMECLQNLSFLQN